MAHLHPNRRGGLLVSLVCLIVVAGIVGGIGYKYYVDTQTGIDPSQLITKTASMGPFDHTVSEQGEIESSSNIEIICEVESKGRGGISILWVIPEGSRVKPGDKLVELDASQLELDLKTKKILVLSAEANVATTKATVEQAKIAKQEYLEGVFKTEEKTILSEMAIAEQNLRKAELAIRSSERLVAKGLIKKLQLDADRFAVSNAQNKLEAEEAKLRVLRELTKKKMLVQFDSDIDAALASLSAAESELLAERNELRELEDQIAKCVMYSPSEGVVVYANKYSSRGGSSEFVVEPGATVRERQTIIYLPDPGKMQVECKVNESRITLIKPGMPARITVDAIPGMSLTGRVSKVNRYAEPGGWMSSGTKEYKTFVEIIEPPENIRTGMTANVQVFVEQLDNTVQIPVQGLYEHGNQLFALKQAGPGKYETVKVKLRATNDTTASIAEGIDENDRIVLNLREHLDLMDLPELKAEDTSKFRELRTVSTDGTDGGPRPVDVQPKPSPGQGGGAGMPAGGGGPPDLNSIVSASMARNDTDSDGKLSADEIGKIDDRFQGMVKAADTDGDGVVTRLELTAALKKRFSGGGGQ